MEAARGQAASVAGGRASGAAGMAAVAILALEVLGIVIIWGPVPVGWMWLGGRLYDLTGSLGADLGLAFLGFIGTTLLGIAALSRLDQGWIALRRRAGHEQEEGALALVVTVAVGLALILFVIWYYALSDAYVLPFMPAQ